MESTISPDQPVVTLINVFTVAPEHQQELVDVLIEATEQVMRNLVGFVSANIHRSLDGTRVTNYAQWRTREDFEAMFHEPKIAPHMARCKALASNDAHLFEVVRVDHRGAQATTW